MSDQIQNNSHHNNEWNEITLDRKSPKNAVDSFKDTFQPMNTSIIEGLSNNFIIRGFLQLASQLPPPFSNITALTDLSISMAADKLKETRDHKFLLMMAEIIDKNEKPETLIANLRKNPEAALDLYSFIQEESQRTQSETKRQRLVNIIRRAAWDDIIWEEAKEYAQIVASLQDHDIAVLSFSNNIPICDDGVFDGLPVITNIDKIQNSEKGPKLIKNEFPNLPSYVIARTCSRLIAEGLLQDNGIGRMDTKAMEYFHITEPGKRFLNWITNQY